MGQSSSPGSKEFSLLHLIQTSSEAHTAFYPMDTRTSSPRLRPLGSEADHSPPTNANVKKMFIYTSTPPHVSMADMVLKHRDNLYYISNR
jgi:hypothetical protein